MGGEKRTRRRRMAAHSYAWRISVTVLALSTLVTSCGQQTVVPPETPLPTASPTAEPTIKETAFALPCYPAGGFHPVEGNNKLNLLLSPLLYQGLFSVDGQFRVKNELCESASTSEDGLVWTFSLREATFSDGSPLTVTEVVSSLEAARKSERYGGRLKDIVRVSATGDREVTVALSRPNGGLPLLLDVPIFKTTDDPQRPLGTGRYYLAGEGDGLALAARDGWAAPVDPIQLRTVSSGDDLVYAFDAREVALVDADLTGSNTLGYSGRYETMDYPTTTLLYVGCNTRAGACADVGVRQALLRAFDREGLVRRVLDRHAVASPLPVHPWTEECDGELAETLRYDPDAAAEMLKLAGWSVDEEGRLRQGRNALTLRLVVNQDNIYKVTMAESLAESLRELGCDVTVEKLPWEEFTAALSRGDFDLYLGETTMTADFDPEELLSGRLNYGGFYDGEVTELLERYRSATGEARKLAGSELWTRVGETAPILPLCFKNGSLLTQWGMLQNATPTQRDVFSGMENWIVRGDS